jgi:ankyrin repeat protein
MLRIIAAGGADLSLALKDGRTALHVALEARRAANAEALLQAGARVDPKDADGQTPLHVAARLDVVEVIPRLLEKGADLRARDRLGDTPLETARRHYRARAEDLLRGAAPR